MNKIVLYITAELYFTAVYITVFNWISCLDGQVRHLTETLEQI